MNFYSIVRLCGSVRAGFYVFSLIILALIAGLFFPDVFNSSLFYIILFFLFLNIVLCAFKGGVFTPRKLASVFSHSGVLIILVGSFLTATGSKTGTMKIAKGETKNRYYFNGTAEKLPFEITLSDFEIDWYRPAQYRFTVFLTKERMKQTFTTEEKKEYSVKGIPYTITVLDYNPDFVPGNRQPPVFSSAVPSMSAQPVFDPAVLVRVSSQGKVYDQWVSVSNPRFNLPGDNSVEFMYVWNAPVKEFRSSISIADKGVTRNAIIKVNSPLRYKGYMIYQASYDPSYFQWAGLTIGRDPGVGWILGGFILLNAGIAIGLYRRARCIPADTKSRESLECI